MLFLGVDFGWTSQPSGVAVLTPGAGGLELLETRLISSPEAVAGWAIETLGGGPGLVAIDAPTIIRNPTGMRPAERQMHHLFGRRHAGCYPSNLGSAFASRTTRLSQSLEAAGIVHAPTIHPQRTGRFQIEVHPHAATLHLFGLQRILKYKKGRLAERRAGLAHFQRLLIDRLAAHEPRLLPFDPPALPARGRALKDVEDQMDAVLCAYIGAWWWHWGRARTIVVGDAQSGFIVVPVSAEEAELGA